MTMAIELGYRFQIMKLFYNYLYEDTDAETLVSELNQNSL